jgi:hypothetical protein
MPRAPPLCCQCHGKTEIAAKALKEREALARMTDEVIPDTREDDEDGEEGLMLFSTPPRLAGES